MSESELPDGAARAVPGPRAVPAPGRAPVTGDDAVDEALRRLPSEDGDLRGQLAAFEDVHGALQDRLADAEG